MAAANCIDIVLFHQYQIRFDHILWNGLTESRMYVMPINPVEFHRPPVHHQHGTVGAGFDIHLSETPGYRPYIQYSSVPGSQHCHKVVQMRGFGAPFFRFHDRYGGFHNGLFAGNQIDRRGRR